MTTTYEPIMNALLTLLQTQCGDTFLYYARGIQVWEELIQNTKRGQPTQILQPALYLFDGVGFGGGRIKYDPRGRGTPQVRTMLRTILIYAQAPGGGTADGPEAGIPCGTIYAPLQEAIDAAFSEEVGDGPGGTQTLGGLVSHCWIEGDAIWVPTEIDPGGQGMVAIPVSIMLP